MTVTSDTSELDTSLPAAKRDSRFLILFIASVILFGAWIDHGQGVNPNARYDAIFGYVEPGTVDTGTLHIDHFVLREELFVNTGDWSRNPDVGPHLYSNKGPGQILAGIWLYTVMYSVEKKLGLIPETHTVTRWNVYILNLFLTLLPAVIGAYAGYRLVTKLLPDRRLAGMVSWFLFFGTLSYPFTTQLLGHTTTASLVIVALYAALGAVDRDRAAAGAGLAAGLAVLCESSAPIVVVAVGVYIAVVSYRAHGASVAMRRVVDYGLGGLGPFLVYAVYHQMCFGNPLIPATFYNNPMHKTDGQLAGIFASEMWLQHLWGLTFGLARGIFVYMPLLLISMVGLVFIRRARHAGFFWLCAAISAAYVLMNMSFNGWHGGGSAGPRYLIPAIPCLALLSIPALERWRQIRHAGWKRASAAAMILLAGVTLVNMVIVTLNSPTSPDGPFPLLDFARTVVAGKPGPRYEPTPIRLGGEWQTAPLPGAPPEDLATLPWEHHPSIHAKLDLAAIYPDAAIGDTVLLRALLIEAGGGPFNMEMTAAGDFRMLLNNQPVDLGPPPLEQIRDIRLNLVPGGNRVLFAATRTGEEWYITNRIWHGEAIYPIHLVSPAIGQAYDLSGLDIGQVLGLPRAVSTYLYALLLFAATALAWRILSTEARDPVLPDPA